VGIIGSCFSLGTWLIAISGAFVLLVFYDALTGRSSTRRSGRVGA